MTSTIKVNTITTESGSTLTVGGCGKTVALASGASQTGFGRTGTVDWQTAIKTSGFTAANGEGYFIDTNSGGFTVNLPAGSAGDIVAFKDYRNTFDTAGLTVSPNGTDKIGGVNANVSFTTESQSVTLIFTDSTRGWLDIHDSTTAATGNPFIVATGGTETTSGNCKIHTFTGPGTFTVSAASATAAENVVSYLIVAGGGASGSGQGTGGGGAGGFREVKSPTTPYTASPLDGYPSAPNRVTVTAQAYPIVVGGGGAADNSAPGCQTQGGQGNTSSFGGISSAGGGGGGGGGGAPVPIGSGGTGGSGGGGGGRGSCGTKPGGAGNTPPTTPAQGSAGGNATTSTSSPSVDSGGGGGGAASAGANGTACAAGGSGGPGQATSITASPVTYAGGGSGGSELGPTRAGTPGGGGLGGGTTTPGNAGTDNLGGGGGGSGNAPSNAKNGGSGIVVIRYKFQ